MQFEPLSKSIWFYNVENSAIGHLSKYLFSFVIILLSLAMSQAQDPIYSQFYNAPLQLNPAFAGNSTNALVAINYRNQWPNWGPKAYATYSVSYDQFFDLINSGFGINVNSDNSGDGIFVTNRISGIYSYRLKFNDDFQAKIGLEASATQNRLDWNKLIFLDQINPSRFETGGGSLLLTDEIQPDNLNSTNFDFSFGILLYSPKVYGGLTIKHLNAPSNKLLSDNANVYSGLPIRLSAHAGYTISIKSGNNGGFGTFLAPSIMLVQQSDFFQINAGALFNKENFFGGAYLRYTISNIDAVIVSLGWRTELFKMSYGFDFTISDASVLNSGGAHELGIVINFGADKKGTDYNDCFKIFR
ncbi:MAG: PorP/SprF family type IX secretion system membrane protein [Saprospiraceae bacterium]